MLRNDQKVKNCLLEHIKIFMSTIAENSQQRNASNPVLENIHFFLNRFNVQKHHLIKKKDICFLLITESWPSPNILIRISNRVAQFEKSQGFRYFLIMDTFLTSHLSFLLSQKKYCTKRTIDWRPRHVSQKIFVIRRAWVASHLTQSVPLENLGTRGSCYEILPGNILGENVGNGPWVICVIRSIDKNLSTVTTQDWPKKFSPVKNVFKHIHQVCFIFDLPKCRIWFQWIIVFLKHIGILSIERAFFFFFNYFFNTENFFNVSTGKTR